MNGLTVIRWLIVWFAGLLMLCAPVIVSADSLMPDDHFANTQLADPIKEQAAKDLMLAVRCLVCQGQSIADSDADMASDMRAMIRKRIDAGETPQSIRAWLIERYGNWVTYDPPSGGVGAPLWIAPILFVGLGLWLARGRFRRASGRASSGSSSSGSPSSGQGKT